MATRSTQNQDKTKTSSSGRDDSKRLRFSIESLRNIAGDKVFDRGVAYHKEGAVDITNLEENCVRASIVGSKIYEAELKLANGKISGHCSCPADRDFGFCKHLVATALTVNDMKTNAAQKTKSRIDLVRDYLHELPKESLVAMIMGQAESDPQMLKGIEMAMKVAHGESGDVFETIKKAITQATTTRGFVGYNRVSTWVQKLESVLSQITALSNNAPNIALDLLDYFFDRMEKVLEEIDDSDGDVGNLCGKAEKVYRQSCRVAKLSPEALAARLFRRETESSWGFFSGASEEYRDIIGKKGLEEYHRLAKDAWDELPSVNPNRTVRDEYGLRRYILKAILDTLAKNEHDLDARIALRTKDLSSPSCYLELADICLEHGRKDEALKWAEEGLWQFKDDTWPDERLKQFTFDLYLKRGDTVKARDLIWNAFLQRPDIDKYAAIKDLSKDLAEQAIAFLQESVSKTEVKRDAKGKAEFESLIFHRGVVSYAERKTAPFVLLAKIFLLEKRLNDAWKIADIYGVPDDLLAELAKVSEKHHTEKSIAAYKMLVERLIGAGNTPSYKKAVTLVDTLKTLQDTEEQTKYVIFLKDKYKAKRNFIKLI